MATYSWLCKCGEITEVMQSISSYCDPETKITPWHCNKPMERMLTVNGANDALANALAGDRHYDGMTATDGTLINSRTKHREYMKRNGLTTIDDFTGVWKRAEAERRERLQGAGDSRARKAILDREFTKAERK